MNILKPFAAVGFSAIAISTSLALAAEWVDGVPIFGKESPAADRKKTTEKYSDDLIKFKKRTFLDEATTAVYANNLQSLIGRYCYIDKDKQGKEVLECFGTSSYAPKENKIDLKDDIAFRAVVNSKFSFGLGLVVFNMKLSTEQIAELTVQDIGQVATNPNANEITCRFPIQPPPEAAGKQFRFIAGAVATTVSGRQFTKGEAGGDAAYAMIKISGTTYTSTEVFSKQKLITVSHIPATPLDPTKPDYAAKLAQCVALLKAKKPDVESATVAMSDLFQDASAVLIPESAEDLAGKVVGVKLRD